jgi:enterochelin esterase-like enzyme
MMKLPTQMKIWIFLLALTIQNNLISAQGSKIFEKLSVHSNILNMERKFSIYLPAGYDQNDRDYPVLYLLHGSGGDQITWVQSGEVQCLADKVIAQGAATPMIIVMPNARDKIKGYFNHIKEGFNYEDFFLKELIPYIEKNYRCRTKRRYRAIAGQSMGGGGTVFYALHHPKMFSAVAPLSAVTGSWSKQELKSKLERKKIENVSDEQFNVYYKKYNINEVLSEAESEKLKNIRSIRWFISCGDGDYLCEGNCRLHISFREAEINHEFRIKDGAHNWSYWREELPEVLSFVSKSFTNF